MSLPAGPIPFDIHNPSGSGTILERQFPLARPMTFPCAAFCPRRSISSSWQAVASPAPMKPHSSYRVMPIAMATGAAVGVCAALAVRTGKRPPRDLPAAQVQHELRRQQCRSTGFRDSATRRGGRWRYRLFSPSSVTLLPRSRLGPRIHGAWNGGLASKISLMVLGGRPLPSGARTLQGHCRAWTRSSG